jgi:hypothetical protein
MEWYELGGDGITRSHLQGPSRLTLEDGTDRLSRNVGIELALYAA